MQVKQPKRRVSAAYKQWQRTLKKLETARDKTLAVPSMHGPKWDYRMKIHYEKLISNHIAAKPSMYEVL